MNRHNIIQTSENNEPSNEQPTTEDDNDEPDVYPVEKILKAKKQGKRTMYLVRWQNYGPADDSWIKEEDVGIPLIREFHTRKQTLPPTTI